MEFTWFLPLTLVFKIHSLCGIFVYTLFLFMILYIPHCGYTIIYLFSSWTFGFLQFWANINAPLSIPLLCFGAEKHTFLPGMYLPVESLGHRVWGFSSLIASVTFCSKIHVPVYPVTRVSEGLHSPTSSTSLSLDFYIFAISSLCSGSSLWFTNEVENFF